MAVTRKPYAFISSPVDEAMTPLPIPEITPPQTIMYLTMVLAGKGVGFGRLEGSGLDWDEGKRSPWTETADQGNTRKRNGYFYHNIHFSSPMLYKSDTVETSVTSNTTVVKKMMLVAAT